LRDPSNNKLNPKLSEIDNFTYNISNGIIYNNKTTPYSNINIFYVNNYGETEYYDKENIGIVKGRSEFNSTDDEYGNSNFL
jgi:hypothetical protein